VSSATLKLFLPFGDPKRLRTAEISNWNGKAVAAPRTELDLLLARDEVRQSGVYVLTGTDPDSGAPSAYVGEAEVIRDRLTQHKGKDFWVHAIVFVSKDENLTKAHIRYLEGRLIELANAAARARVMNAQGSGSRLPESDREDMEVFLGKIRQLLPVLGSDILTPILAIAAPGKATQAELLCEIKGLVARGHRTPDGFVVLPGSQAVLELRPSAATAHPFVIPLRDRLVADGTLVQEGTFLRFTRVAEFSSPSAAASVIHGGGANGLTSWKDPNGRTLKDIEATQAV